MNDYEKLNGDFKYFKYINLLVIGGILGAIIFIGIDILLLVSILLEYTNAKFLLLLMFVLLLTLSIISVIVGVRKMDFFKRGEPYKIVLDKEMNYNCLTNILKIMSFKNDYLDVSDNQSIYRIKDKFDYRIFVSNINSFNKKEYDETKKMLIRNLIKNLVLRIKSLL